MKTKNEFKAGQKLNCPKCGYEWVSKKAKPRKCPNCQRIQFTASGEPKPWSQVQ